VACQVLSDLARQQQGQADLQVFSNSSDGCIVQAQNSTEKIGVLLLNLGGPDSLDDVQPFLYNLFADPDIIRLPKPIGFLQPAIAQLASTLRASKSQEGYAAIGGGSPLRRITEEQAAALAAALHARGLDAEAYVAMRYWNPYTEEALEQVKRDGVNRLVILPLYPQFSVSTSGSSLRLLEKLFKSDPALAKLKHTVIPSWCACPRPRQLPRCAARLRLRNCQLSEHVMPTHTAPLAQLSMVPKLRPCCCPSAGTTARATSAPWWTSWSASCRSSLTSRRWRSSSPRTASPSRTSPKQVRGAARRRPGGGPGSQGAGPTAAAAPGAAVSGVPAAPAGVGAP
jgi:hypothetical protein